MNSLIQRQRIASLILKERLLGLNSLERNKLAAWKTANVHNTASYERLKNKHFNEDIDRYRHIDVDRGFACYRQKYPVSPVKKHRIGYAYWVAALVVLLIGTPSLFFFYADTKEYVADAIVPGSSKAILILGDGRMIDLSVSQNQVITESGSVSIKNSGLKLDYEVSQNANVSPDIYNELRIPIGGEYSLTMSDGTKVWLNADTRLRYPAAFSKTERCVYLEGEAYFEVKKDETRPFRVILKDAGNIEVLGTSFNVCAYNDDRRVETILEEGRIKMNSGVDSVIMSPGSRSVYDFADRKIKTTEVNAGEYTIWRHGEFIFHTETIGDIMKKLARWYGVQVVYLNQDAQRVLFSGSVKRYEDIRTLLDAMELSGGVNFEISGRTIMVR